MRPFEFSIQEKSIVFSASTPKSFMIVDVDFSFTLFKISFLKDDKVCYKFRIFILYIKFKR